MSGSVSQTQWHIDSDILVICYYLFLCNSWSVLELYLLLGDLGILHECFLQVLIIICWISFSLAQFSTFGLLLRTHFRFWFSEGFFFPIVRAKWNNLDIWLPAKYKSRGGKSHTQMQQRASSISWLAHFCNRLCTWLCLWYQSLKQSTLMFGDNC